MIFAARLGLAAIVATVPFAACAADPRSDAPEERVVAAAGVPTPASYDAALRAWHGVDDVNAWIGASFRYDAARAMRLSESRRANTRMDIHRPDDFYAVPSGVCVDLARFGVETLRAIDPSAKPVYVMIEFAPVVIAGNVLRRHWLVGIERDGRRYFFADSKRPGHLAGPYASTRAFLDDYMAYRGREIVSFRELPSYERTKRRLAAKQVRDDRTAAQ